MFREYLILKWKSVQKEAETIFFVLTHILNNESFIIALQKKLFYGFVSANSSENTLLSPSAPYHEQAKFELAIEVANVRIEFLENEVTKLKSQISSLMSHPTSDITRFNHPKSSNQILTVFPPPPPPPLPPSNFFKSQNDNLEYIKAQIKKSKSEPNVQCQNNQTPMISLAEVMKNAKTVKLRKVERSPGGTPLRRKPLQDTRRDGDNVEDLGSFLAKAMQKRFNTLNPSGETSSPDSSFHFSPSPEYLQRNRRQKWRSSFGDLSPLKEINF